MKPRTELRRMSAKRQAKLEAEGKRVFSTLTPSAPPKSKPSKRSPGTRTGMMRRSSKPIAKANPERQAKRRKSYAQKLAAYKRSDTYRIVEARAEGRCERIRGVSGKVAREFTGENRAEFWRCERSRERGDRLTHNHKTYARFGGNELPEDVELLCDACNTEYEAQHPTRNRNYSSARRAQGGGRV